MNALNTLDPALSGLYFSLLIVSLVVPVARLMLEIFKNNWPL